MKKNNKKVLITGITGQDGAYLARLLLNKGYEVHGVKRRSSSFNTIRIDQIYNENLNKNNFFLHYGDLTDTSNLIRLIKEIGPSQIYNLAAQSHVKVSFETAEYTANADAIGTLRILEGIRTLGKEKEIKFYQASTSELYGKVREVPQNEETPFYPRSPYAVAKLYAYWMTINFREAYGMHACNGILFNHESPLRGETFVTQKIAMAAAKISSGQQDCLYLGNLDAKRDWGHAKDFVEGMYKILNHSTADDFVLATGRSETVRNFVKMAFNIVDIQIEWNGKGVNEVGINKKNGKPIIKVDRKYFRPTEVDILIGDYSKAREILKWEPKIKLETIVEEMVIGSINELKKNINNFPEIDF